jgi:hypothetical protein
MTAAWFPQTDVEHAMQYEIDTLRAENERLAVELRCTVAERHRAQQACEQMGAENERLKRLNDVLAQQSDTVDADLMAENERLRAMLVTVTDELEHEINASYDEKYGDHPAMDNRRHRDLGTVREARAALQSKGEKE